MAIEEEIVIEVRNSDIQRLLLSMFKFMQDHSRKIDVNALLRDLIAKQKSYTIPNLRYNIKTGQNLERKM
ncbi:hypothetical protein KC865_03280 [Candidatus Kaiserbacteria bacterium]|nr:hypothetical protein [Candidatus Kaiserbacteria bacterium]USN92487.1 MAG: hypothetical protein H6782_01575 [Candidatus Nomurabacteria bacterium]